MRTLRTGYFIVNRNGRELIGPNKGVGYKTRKAAEAALERWPRMDGYVQLFKLTAIAMKKEPEDDKSGYFSRHN